MLELVMVIVVLGIVASLAVPRLDRDLRQEAADNILSDIRYTQHLALSDYQHSTNPIWQRGFWRIGFRNCSGGGLYTVVGSDNINDLTGSGEIGANEAAMDPTTGKKMHWVGSSSCPNGGDDLTSDRIFITHKFGVKTFATSGSCSGNQYIGFDHLGRMHNGFAASSAPNYASYKGTNCVFTFTMSDDTTFKIIIEPETGHAYIDGQLDS